MNNIQIILVRNNSVYLYSRVENGRCIVTGEPITAARAAEIHRANENALQKGSGEVNFNGSGSQWERSYFVEVVRESL